MKTKSMKSVLVEISRNDDYLLYMNDILVSLQRGRNLKDFDQDVLLFLIRMYIGRILDYGKCDEKEEEAFLTQYKIASDCPENDSAKESIINYIKDYLIDRYKKYCS